MLKTEYKIPDTKLQHHYLKQLSKFVSFNTKAGNGFTLIELLIVVAIISILSTLLLVNFIAVRQRGRDAERKSDLRQIQSALELYRADNDSYPLAVPNCNSTSLGYPPGASPAECTSIYMNKVPTDPNSPDYYNSGNYYYNTPDSGGTYTLASCVENTADKDQNICTTSGAEGIPACPSGLTGCTSSYYYVLQNP